LASTDDEVAVDRRRDRGEVRAENDPLPHAGPKLEARAARRPKLEACAALVAGTGAAAIREIDVFAEPEAKGASDSVRG
jgi:hypothetical protein